MSGSTRSLKDGPRWLVGGDEARNRSDLLVTCGTLTSFATKSAGSSEFSPHFACYVRTGFACTLTHALFGLYTLPSLLYSAVWSTLLGTLSGNSVLETQL